MSDTFVLRERHIIDLFKGLTALFVFVLILATGSFDRADAWVYLGIHGTYGLLWVTKSRVFGDRNWERPVTPVRGGMLIVGLLGYWAAPVLLCASSTQAPPWLIGCCVALFSFGVFLHFAADMQKHVHLAARKGVLLTDGLWARSRNPNYLGELLIYLSFALLSCHWIPFVIFGAAIASEWVPNMRRKDASLARYPEFAAWKDRSGLIFPRIFG